MRKTEQKLWRELATIQTQLEQIEARLTPLADKHAKEDCCEFCTSLRTAADNVQQAVAFIGRASLDQLWASTQQPKS